jgi:hypothetical protein
MSIGLKEIKLVSNEVDLGAITHGVHLHPLRANLLLDPMELTGMKPLATGRSERVPFRYTGVSRCFSLSPWLLF